MGKFCCSSLVVSFLFLSVLPQKLVAQNEDAGDTEEVDTSDTLQESIDSQDAAQDPTIDNTSEAPTEDRRPSNEQLAKNTFLLGIGRSSLGGGTKNFGSAAVQWGLQYNRSVYSFTDNLSFNVALDFRYSKHSKDLQAVRLSNTSAKSTLKRIDYSCLFGLHYGVIENAALFTEIGPSMQSRSIWIDADSGGDYYRDNVMGYLWRLGAQYQYVTGFGKILTNLFYGMNNGSEIKSGLTKYNLQKVNYNGPSSTLGIELGLAL